MHDLLASASVFRRDLERLQDHAIDLRKHVMDIADTLERDAGDDYKVLRIKYLAAQQTIDRLRSWNAGPKARQVRLEGGVA